MKNLIAGENSCFIAVIVERIIVEDAGDI